MVRSKVEKRNIALCTNLQLTVELDLSDGVDVGQLVHQLDLHLEEDGLKVVTTGQGEGLWLVHNER